MVKENLAENLYKLPDLWYGKLNDVLTHATSIASHNIRNRCIL